jgi:hypothetical protein
VRSASQAALSAVSGFAFAVEPAGAFRAGRFRFPVLETYLINGSVAYARNAEIGSRAVLEYLHA